MEAQSTYNYKVVRQFTVMTVIWGVVGMLVGVIIAAQLLWPELNMDVPWLTYGRLRPLHTNAVIFAFGGCALFATSYYVVQRTCHVRLFGEALAAFTFWGWQAVIVLAAVTLPLGITSGKEYAELEWPIDILIALVWVSYAIVFFGTIAKRKTPHIYVANWFYGAFILTVALLHIVNSAASPVSFWKSYSAYAGVQDAMVQWWYGHNAVGFFLTAGFLGIMYYFIPKQAGRPVYSYRLSVVHFWALIFTYMWAGPHHLHYTALPDWAQSIGMLFSLILLAPSWGGMINGIMTLSGAWHKLRDDPILKFLIVSLSFYGMSTFEGPMMSIKTVNALSHYTDWTIGHVHSGALGCQVDAVRIEPESGLLIEHGPRRRVGRKALEVGAKLRERSPDRVADVPGAEQIDADAERLEPDVGEQAHHTQRGVPQPAAVVDVGDLRRRRAVEAHVGFAVTTPCHGAVGHREIGERGWATEDRRLLVGLADEPSQPPGRFESSPFDLESAIQDRPEPCEVESSGAGARTRIAHFGPPCCGSQQELGCRQTVAIGVHLDLERGELSSSVLRQPSALPRERMTQHGPRLVPRLLRRDGGVDSQCGVRIRRRVERGRRKARTQVSFTVAFEGKPPGSHQFHPGGLRVPRLPERSDLDHRRVRRRRQPVERVGQDEGVRLEDRVEKTIGERVGGALARGGHRPPSEPAQHLPDRLSRMRQLPAVDELAVVHGQPSSGRILRRHDRRGGHEGENRQCQE